MRNVYENFLTRAQLKILSHREPLFTNYLPGPVRNERSSCRVSKAHALISCFLSPLQNAFFITARQRTCEKVMFYSCLSVCRVGGDMMPLPVWSYVLSGCLPLEGSRGLVLISSGGHRGRQYASYWNVFLLSITGTRQAARQTAVKH